MADRRTMNVSLPEAQESFVRGQVQSGRYRSSSEVVRDGLRLLEEAEHRRLLETWMRDGLSAAERRRLPRGLLARAKRALNDLLEVGLRDASRGRIVDGPAAMKQLRASVARRPSRRSA